MHPEEVTNAGYWDFVQRQHLNPAPPTSYNGPVQSLGNSGPPPRRRVLLADPRGPPAPAPRPALLPHPPAAPVSYFPHSQPYQAPPSRPVLLPTPLPRHHPYPPRYGSNYGGQVPAPKKYKPSQSERKRRKAARILEEERKKAQASSGTSGSSDNPGSEECAEEATSSETSGGVEAIADSEVLATSSAPESENSESVDTPSTSTVEQESETIATSSEARTEDKFREDSESKPSDCPTASSFTKNDIINSEATSSDAPKITKTGDSNKPPENEDVKIELPDDIPGSSSAKNPVEEWVNSIMNEKS
ncbi:hypothetical protein CRE_21163 [Caenorhabditis remanei]|uniref:Uncharacterized protein n=1 Tax=Caenorhabditis remanei TaxID=31234 RepID=E3MF25_CAERE|nr:hypothetical protein CRE_21163 [Caenorhabditis remanei]